jgi:SAM-dependent methyltransferase
MRRLVVMAAGAGTAAAVVGVAAVAARSRGAPGAGWLARVFYTANGVPSGPLGWVSAREMPLDHRPVYATMAQELVLRPDDDVLDVGCGAAAFLQRHAAHARHVAGLDLSDIQVGLAQRRLADRIAAGTAEIVKGDAIALPWPDGHFSVVTATYCLEFVLDPLKALSEMQRVLRPGGRAVLSLGLPTTDASLSGTKTAWGFPRWSEADARRLMEETGFSDVSVSPPPTTDFFFQFAQGVKPAPPSVGEAADTPALAQEARG